MNLPVRQALTTINHRNSKKQVKEVKDLRLRNFVCEKKEEINKQDKVEKALLLSLPSLFAPLPFYMLIRKIRIRHKTYGKINASNIHTTNVDNLMLYIPTYPSAFS